MKPSVKLFVIASLLLNVLLVGVMLGRMGRDFMPPPPPVQSGDAPPPYEAMAKTLPEPARAPYLEAMHRYEADTAHKHADLERLREESADLLKAEPFDKKAYVAKTEEIRKLRSELAGKMMLTVANLAGSLSQEERAGLAELVLKCGFRRSNCAPQPKN